MREILLDCGRLGRFNPQRPKNGGRGKSNATLAESAHGDFTLLGEHVDITRRHAQAGGDVRSGDKQRGAFLLCCAFAVGAVIHG